MYDIVIIGAGPAGSTLARMLNSKNKVLIIDKREMKQLDKRDNEVCCGGLLAPDAQKMLAKLGLGLPQEVVVGPQMFSVKTLDFDNDIERYYQRHYINIDREKFDRWLVSKIPNTVETAYGCLYQKFIKGDDHIEVHYKNNNVSNQVKTRILVGADGAISRVRGQGFKGDKMPEPYVSIQEWFKTDKVMPHYISVFDQEVTDFYSWLIQKDDSILLGTAIPKGQEVNKQYFALLSKLKEGGYISGKPYKKTGTLIMRTRSHRHVNTVKDNIVLIGEAAGFISPSSAEGISYALMSGAMLANSINKNDDHFATMYKKKIKKIKRNLFIKNLKVLLMYNKHTRRWIMKSRILSMDASDIDL